MVEFLWNYLIFQYKTLLLVIINEDTQIQFENELITDEKVDSLNAQHYCQENQSPEKIHFSVPPKMVFGISAVNVSH